jgi:hypothetical protein
MVTGMKKPKSKPIAEIIVRRGALRRFDRLTRDASKLPVEVSWDRRVNEPEAPPGTERRRQPPFTWDTADFVVVDPPKRRKRKTSA